MAETIEVGHIPVYVSDIGIDWSDERLRACVHRNIGDRATIYPGTAAQVGCVIASEIRWHDEAPEIEGPHGTGRWVRQVVTDDDGRTYAISIRDIGRTLIQREVSDG